MAGSFCSQRRAVSYGAGYGRRSWAVTCQSAGSRTRASFRRVAPGRLRRPGRVHLALGLELEEVRVHLVAAPSRASLRACRCRARSTTSLIVRRALPAAACRIWRSRILRCATYSSSTAVGILDHVAVPGTDPRQPLDLAQSFERREVLRHVAAALRVHDGGRAVQHVVAGEQHPLLVEEEAQMVRRVTGRVERLEPELGAVDRVAVAEHEVERRAVDLVGLRELAEARDLRAGLLADLLGRRPVIGMRVREQHPAHAVPHRRADDRVDVLREIAGPGSITATSSMPTRYVFVPGSGHQTRVVRDDAPDERRQRARRFRCQIGHGASRMSSSSASTRSNLASVSRLR